MKIRFNQGVVLGNGKIAYEGEEKEVESIPNFLIGKVQMVKEQPAKKKSNAKEVK